MIVFYGFNNGYSRKKDIQYITELPKRSNESQLKCFIVYSDKKYVEYIEHIVGYVKTTLKSHGYESVILGEEIRSSKDYKQELFKKVDEKTFAVMIFDGFRPNKLFEFG